MATTKKKATATSKKPGAKKTVPAKNVKKAAPAAKKAAKAKPAAKKPVVKKPAAKKVVAKKAVKASPKKPLKSTPKKVAKPESKKSTPKKVESKTSKKLATKKTTPVKETKAKAPVPVKTTPVKKVVEKKVEKKEKTLTHQEMLKNAVKARKVEEKKKEEKLKAFKMPEITTDRSRKYNPSFTKSILDLPQEIPTGPTMRYSDAELKEFKDLIMRKLESAKKELAYLQGLITRKDQMGGDESDNRYMTMEDGSLSMEREQLSQMASRQITFIDHLEKALMRIENKTYGICRVTGKLIDKARLRAVPHATLSIEAKMGIAK